MEEFLASWEATKEAEAERLATLEAEIVATLGAIGRRLAALPSPADYLALEQDLTGSHTLDTLTADHAQLALYLNKVCQVKLLHGISLAILGGLEPNSALTYKQYKLKSLRWR